MRRFQGVAAVLFASAAACGKTTALSDAPTGDGKQIDSNANIDAAAGQVTVITKSRKTSTSPAGTVVAGVSVYAVQPSGTAGATGQTDSNGKVVLDGVLPGASITAVYMADATDYQVVTVVGVKPGDTITLGDLYALAPAGGNTGVLNVTFPSVTGATSYQVYSPCNSTSGAASPIALPESCVLPSANLVLIAADATGNTLAGGVIKSAPYTDGQTAALTAWSPVPSGGFTVSISGLIADVTQAGLWGDMVVDGGAYVFDRGQTISPLTGGAASANFQLPGAGDRTSVGATLYRTKYGDQETYSNVAPTATSATLPAPGLPWLGSRQLDASGQTVAWLQFGSGAYDGGFANIQWSRTVATTTTQYNWNILVPPGQSSFAWGTPTAALAPYVPAAADTFNQFHVQLVDLSSATDYDQLRAAPEWQWQSPYNTTEDGELTGVSSVAYGAEGNTTTGSISAGRTR
jgi:hypothetical protein